VIARRIPVASATITSSSPATLVGAFISSSSNNRNGKGKRQAATSHWFRAKEGNLGSLWQRHTVHKRGSGRSTDDLLEADFGAFRIGRDATTIYKA
jgi:hypothetical protein